MNAPTLMNAFLLAFSLICLGLTNLNLSRTNTRLRRELKESAEALANLSSANENFTAAHNRYVEAAENLEAMLRERIDLLERCRVAG